MSSKVSITKCGGYEFPLVEEATRKAVDLLGGITSFVKPQSKVLVKPNLLLAKEPECGITTHPHLVRAVPRILKDIKCKIFLGDGPSVWGEQAKNIEEVYERCGMKRISEEEGIEIVRFDNRRWRGKFPLTTWLDYCDCFISLPKFKTHELTILTAAIKNLFGLVSGTYKTELHKRYFDREGFSKILVDIYQEARPALTIIDGIVAMEGDGPASSGKLRKLGLLFAASDCVALDSVLSVVMGLNPYEIPTNKEAGQRKLGAADIDSIQILGEKLKDVIPQPFQLPTSSTLRKIVPRPVINLLKDLVRFYPKIIHKDCTLCNACIMACPKKIIGVQNNRVVIDYSGCIFCFCCQEACPASAIKIKKSILAKLLRL